MDKLFLACDGDRIGYLIGASIQRDDVEEVRRINQRIEAGNQILVSWALEHGGSVVEEGGDECYLAEIPVSALGEVESVRQKYHSATGATLTIGIGRRMSEAGQALLVGKIEGRDRVRLFDETVPQTLAEANKPKTEDEKIADEYLSPQIGLAKSFGDQDPLFTQPATRYRATTYLPAGHPDTEKAAGILEMQGWKSAGNDQYHKDFEHPSHGLDELHTINKAYGNPFGGMAFDDGEWGRKEGSWKGPPLEVDLRDRLNENPKLSTNVILAHGYTNHPFGSHQHMFLGRMKYAPTHHQFGNPVIPAFGHMGESDGDLTDHDIRKLITPPKRPPHTAMYGKVNSDPKFFVTSSTVPIPKMTKAENEGSAAHGGHQHGVAPPKKVHPHVQTQEHSEGEVAHSIADQGPAPEMSHQAKDAEDQFHELAGSQDKQDRASAARNSEEMESLKQRVAESLTQLKGQLPVITQLKGQFPETYKSILSLVQSVVGLARGLQTGDQELEKAEKRPKVWTSDDWGTSALKIPSKNHPDRQAFDQNYLASVASHYTNGDTKSLKRIMVPVALLEGGNSGGAANKDRYSLYHKMLRAGDEVPPIVVAPGNPGAWSVKDGTHRVEAAKAAGVTHLPAYVVRAGLKKAIADLKPGKTVGEPTPLNSRGSTQQNYDYSHMLTPEHTKQGYKLIVSHMVHPGRQDEIKSRVYHSTGSGSWQPETSSPLRSVGQVHANIVEGSIEPHSSLGPSYRGQGLGKKMYEALYTHAKHIAGVDRVTGGVHSEDASKVHRALAVAHGLWYFPEKREAYGEDPDDEHVQRYPYMDYDYQIKGELAPDHDEEALLLCPPGCHDQKIEKAISDISPGPHEEDRPIPETNIVNQVYDYNHLLTPSQRSMGLTLKVHQRKEGHKQFPSMVEARLSKSNYGVQQNLGGAHGHINPSTNAEYEFQDQLQGEPYLEPHSQLEKEYRGKGLGKAAYKALYAHVHHTLGVNHVVGGEHSAAADRVHRSLAGEMGLNYVSKKRNPKSGFGLPLEQYPYDSYHYQLKDELAPDHDEEALLLCPPGCHDQKIEKAISDLKPGKFQGETTFPNGDDDSGDPVTQKKFDYGHLLTPEQKEQGLSLHVHHSFQNNENGKERIVARLTRPGRDRPRYVGAVTGYVRPPNSVRTFKGYDPFAKFTRLEPHSDLDEQFRGQGLGKAMYEALYAHAKHVAGIDHVQGGPHSPQAEAVHIALSKKHGLEHVPYVLRPEDGSDDPEISATRYPYAGYQYQLKGELAPDHDEETLLLCPPGCHDQKIEKAIADVPTGKHMSTYQDANGNDVHLHDYSHLLPQGTPSNFKMFVRHNPSKNYLSTYINDESSNNPLVGNVQGYIKNKHIEPHADLDLAHHGKGFGKAMYLATYSHAKNKLGVEGVAGGMHSAQASAVHRSLAATHGLDYKVDPINPDGSGIHGSNISHMPYKYALKAELAPNVDEEKLLLCPKGCHDQKVEKAIKDIPVGKYQNVDRTLHGTVVARNYNYSHLLPEEMRKTHSLVVQERRHGVGGKYNVHHIVAELHNDAQHMTDGDVHSDVHYRNRSLGTGAEKEKWEGMLTPHSFLSSSLRGRGLGKAMYEALYSHAKNKLGIKDVQGGSHSEMAHRVHQSLAEKHGMSYNPEPDDYVDNRGVKWHGPYQYTLKGEFPAEKEDDLLICGPDCSHHVAKEEIEPNEKFPPEKELNKESMPPTHKDLELPVGSLHNGHLKVQHADGTVGWKGVTAGLIQGLEPGGAGGGGANSHAVSSREPNSP